jgi:hypothetical protein
MRIPQDLLALAGEYRVCSELCKRGVFATVTYGNRKSADLYAIDDTGRRALRIEVKTSQRRQFVTSISQKGLYDDPAAPAFWVLCQMVLGDDGAFTEKFFVLSHEEICKVQATCNRTYVDSFLARRGREPDMSKGVDNVTLKDVEEFEDKWFKIVEAMASEVTYAKA